MSKLINSLKKTIIRVALLLNYTYGNRVKLHIVYGYKIPESAKLLITIKDFIFFFFFEHIVYSTTHLGYFSLGTQFFD